MANKTLNAHQKEIVKKIMAHNKKYGFPTKKKDKSAIKK